MEINNRPEREGIERGIAAAALWRVSHNCRSALAGAASVFMGFPEEVRAIIASEPGQVSKRSYAAVLTGVHYQVPGLAEADLEVEVVEFHISKDGKSLGRKAVVGVVDGQLQPKDRAYPRNMIGCAAANETQPFNGKYHARITQATKNSWKVFLKSV